MLTESMQIQAIADRLAGMPVQVDAREFDMPWKLCWQALESATPGQEDRALHSATAGLVNQQKILERILAVRPGYRPVIPSLEDIAPTLNPIEWVWDGWIPRGLITVLAASQGSGKSFVATDLAWRVIHDKGFPAGGGQLAGAADRSGFRSQRPTRIQDDQDQPRDVPQAARSFLRAP